MHPKPSLKLVDRRPQLTERQREILNWITEYMRAAGMAPSLLEMRMGVGLSEVRVGVHLDVLERAGYLRRRKGRERSIELLTPRGEVVWPR